MQKLFRRFIKKESKLSNNNLASKDDSPFKNMEVDEDLFALVERELEEAVAREEKQTFVVSIMGQTGVGKSSLLNALFGTNLRTDPVRPCTKEVEAVSTIVEDPKTHKKYTLQFNDLPGVGESDSADERYVDIYLDVMQGSDVILWALHADELDVSLDIRTLNLLLQRLHNDIDRAQLVSRLTFVMTKCDSIGKQPWTAVIKSEKCQLIPTGVNRSHIDDRALYFQEKLFGQLAFNKLLVSETYKEEHDVAVDLQKLDPRFTYDDHTIRFQGYIDEAIYEMAKTLSNKHHEIINRLRLNQKVIPSSSIYRFNLLELLLSILNKLGSTAIFRFRKFADETIDPWITSHDLEKLKNFAITDGTKWLMGGHNQVTNDPAYIATNINSSEVSRTNNSQTLELARGNKSESPTVTIVGKLGLDIKPIQSKVNTSLQEAQTLHPSSTKPYIKTRIVNLISTPNDISEDDFRNLKDSKLILWLFHAEMRTTYPEIPYLAKVVKSLSKSEAQNLAARSIIILTKAHTLNFSPWIAWLTEGEMEVQIHPYGKTVEIMNLKREYFADNFAEVFRNVHQLTAAPPPVIFASDKFCLNAHLIERLLRAYSQQTEKSSQAGVISKEQFHNCPNFYVMDIANQSWIYNTRQDLE